MDRQEMKQKKMMGAILPGNSTVELREFDMPKPGHGQVVVKAMATTICGSDIRCIYREHVGKGPEGYIPGTVAGQDRKSTRLNSSHDRQSRMPSSA